MIKIGKALTFDDVLLVPKYSDILPTDTDVSVIIGGKLTLKTPILSAAMDTVTEAKMAVAISKSGGLGIIHRNMDAEKQVNLVREVKAQGCIVGAAVGVSDEARIRTKALIEAGVDVIVFDTAHGHTKLVVEAVKDARKNYPELIIIAGNIATGDAAKALADAGVDAVKVGMGPGAICTTRIVSGIGVPQFSAIVDVSNALKDSNVSIIADGGIKYSGDITKAIAAGAHCVMLGRMLAGTDESPGDIIEKEGLKYKSYRGMGSVGAIGQANAGQGSGDRYFQHKRQGKFIPEGIEGLVPYLGPVAEILEQMVGGLRLGMGYVGAANIKILHEKAEFVKITNAARNEGHAHSMAFVEKAPNYQ